LQRIFRNRNCCLNGSINNVSLTIVNNNETVIIAGYDVE
jgi:hypothetical protein